MIIKHDKPLISVIVPVYNVEDYLRECLNSLIHQSYNNLEIIIINDGSTDGSLTICKEFEALDSRIILLSQENRGLSCARNAGIERIHGDFFTFVDSDDYLDEKFIECLYTYITKWCCDIAICGTTYEWTTHKKRKEPSNSRVVRSTEVIKMFILKKDGIIQTAWGKLFRSKIAKTIHFPEGKLYEDQFVMYRVILDYNCCIVNGTTYYYRQLRPGSILNTKNNLEQKVNDLWQSLCYLKELLKNQPIDWYFYLHCKIAVDSLDIIRYCIIGSYNNKIYQLALDEIKETNLLILKRVGLDLFTLTQIFMVKYSFSLYAFLLIQKYKE